MFVDMYVLLTTRNLTHTHGDAVHVLIIMVKLLSCLYCTDMTLFLVPPLASVEGTVSSYHDRASQLLN